MRTVLVLVLASIALSACAQRSDVGDRCQIVFRGDQDEQRRQIICR